MKIQITCDSCGNKFERKLGEYNRSQKLGRKSFCTSKCASINNIENIPINKRSHVNNPLNGRPKDEFSDFRPHLKSIRRRCIIKKTNLKITLEDLKELWEKQKGICPYTNIKMNVRSWRKKLPTNASVDRIDSSKGYTKDNIQFVCCSINLAKCDFTDEQIKEFILEIKES
jgi:hypothetical protein